MKLRVLLIIMSLAISLIPVAIITGILSFQIATVYLILIMAVTFVVSYIVSYYVTRPLATLTKNINRISKGDLEVQLERSEITEINELTESLDRVMASLKLAITKVGVKKEEIFAQAMKAREEIETKYHHLLKTMDGFVWEVNPTGRCTACTEKAAQSLGQPTQNLVGQDMAVFFNTEQSARLRQQLTEAIAKNRTNPFVLDHVARHANGRDVYLQTRVIPMTDQAGKVTGLFCYSRDLSDDQTALAQVEQLQEKIKTLNTNVNALFQPSPTAKPAPAMEPDFMVLFDDELKIVDCPPCHRETLGGHSIEEILTFTGYTSIRAALDAAKTRGSLPVIITKKTKTGTIKTTGTLEYLRDRNLYHYHPDLETA
jgi:PAS domain S-box-containing protein